MYRAGERGVYGMVGFLKRLRASGQEPLHLGLDDHGDANGGTKLVCNTCRNGGLVQGKRSWHV